MKYLGRERKPKLFSGLESQANYIFPNLDPVFISGAGRSGTHFMAKLFDVIPGIKPYHLDDVGDAIGDSFELFRKWNKIDIGNLGFINSRGFLIKQAADHNSRFLESNPLIAFSLADLHSKFGGRIIIVIRNPKKVVESFFRKGWYSKVYVTENTVAGYQYFHDRPNHYFSRFTPRTYEDSAEWLRLPRLGKIAWMWKSTYIQILEQVSTLPQNSVKFIQLESFNFDQFEKLLAFLELRSTVSPKVFDGIVKSRPGQGEREEVYWDQLSKDTFNAEVSKVLQELPPAIHTDGWLF